MAVRYVIRILHKDRFVPGQNLPGYYRGAGGFASPEPSESDMPSTPSPRKAAEPSRPFGTREQPVATPMKYTPEQQEQMRRIVRGTDEDRRPSVPPSAPPRPAPPPAVAARRPVVRRGSQIAPIPPPSRSEGFFESFLPVHKPASPLPVARKPAQRPARQSAQTPPQRQPKPYVPPSTPTAPPQKGFAGLPSKYKFADIQRGAVNPGTIEAANYLNSVAGGDIRHFTSFNDSTSHMRGSKHYQGLAYDVSMKQKGNRKVEARVANAMNGSFKEAGLSPNDARAFFHLSGGRRHLHVEFRNRKAADRYAAYQANQRQRQMASDPYKFFRGE